MNRREVLSSMAAACGAAGVQARLDLAPAEPRPLLAIIHCEQILPTAALDGIRNSWERLRKLSPEIPPCVVLEKGLRLELATPPEGWHK